MSVHGFGLGASVVGGFSDAHKSAIKAGFPDTIDTYGLVSGLWTSVFAFGAFVGEREFLINFFNLFLSGPTFGGILFDAVTFRWAIFLVIIAEFISLVMLVSYLCIEMCGSTGTPSPSTSGASDTDQVYSSLQGHLVGIEFNQVPSLPTIGEGYGTTSPTIGTRMRLYSDILRLYSWGYTQVILRERRQELCCLLGGQVGGAMYFSMHLIGQTGPYQYHIWPQTWPCFWSLISYLWSNRLLRPCPKQLWWPRSMSHGGSHSGFHTAGLGGLENSRRGGEREPLIPWLGSVDGPYWLLNSRCHKYHGTATSKPASDLAVLMDTLTSQLDAL